MCNYLSRFISRFIPKLSQVSEPLRALTESNKDVVWGKVEQEHFEQMKALISEDQLLRFYDVKKPTTIHCDAITKDEGSWCHPIARGTPYHVSFQVTHQSRKKLCGIGTGVPCNSFCMPEVSPLYLWEAYVRGNRPQATGGDCQESIGCPQKVAENASTTAVV